MSYWLLKTEPHVWSWKQQLAQGYTDWDGVRNFQAQKYIQSMKVGDFAYFYHSTPDKKIMGIVRISQESSDDQTDPTRRFKMVKVETLSTLKNPVTLVKIKAQDELSHLPLIRQSRLSVMPIDKESWNIILRLSEEA